MQAFPVLAIMLAFVLHAAPSLAAASAADRGWIAGCMAQLVSEHDDAKARRVYCTCMHDYFEDNERVTQSAMEHMFPPAHRLRHAKAGWK